jgi:hypothetical protein
MPMMTVYIAEVRPRLVARGLTRFEVMTEPSREYPGAKLLSTMNPLKASLCDQAAKHRQLITLATRDTRFGQEIVTAELHAVLNG